MKKSFQLVIILFIFLIGITIFILLIKHKARPKSSIHKKIIPVVEVICAKPIDYQIIIESNGEVKPLSIGNIVSEVKGKVTYVSENLRQGSMVKKGELLIQIDKRDYEFALSQAISQLKQANSTLIKTKEEAKQAKKEWELIHKGERIPPLAAKLPQLEAAKAAFLAAKASVSQARLNLQRTSLCAPYTGVVIKRDVDIGNVVSYGQILAQIYPTKAVEVHIPLPMFDVAWIDIPGYTVPPSSNGSIVLIEYSMEDKKIQFTGKITRSIGQIDKNTRMLYVIATVKSPFKKLPPLIPSTFVHVKIKGHILKHVFLLPIKALFEGHYVLKVVNNRIKKVRVNITRLLKDSFIVSHGIFENDQLIISPISGDVDGMDVKVLKRIK